MSKGAREYLPVVVGGEKGSRISLAAVMRWRSLGFFWPRVSGLPISALVDLVFTRFYYYSTSTVFLYVAPGQCGLRDINGAELFPAEHVAAYLSALRAADGDRAQCRLPVWRKLLALCYFVTPETYVQDPIRIQLEVLAKIWRRHESVDTVFPRLRREFLDLLDEAQGPPDECYFLDEPQDPGDEHYLTLSIGPRNKALKEDAATTYVKTIKLSMEDREEALVLRMTNVFDPRGHQTDGVRGHP